MATSSLGTDHRVAVPRTPPHRPPPARGRARLVVAVVAASVFVGVLGLLVADQVYEHQEFERVQSALRSTDHARTLALGQLAQLHHDVNLLTAQIGDDVTAYDLDRAQLEGTRAALALTRANVSQQGALITALHTCLSGVEEALNALSVGNTPAAVSQLRAVTSSCTTVSRGG